jgi:hypothetical protein
MRLTTRAHFVRPPVRLAHVSDAEGSCDGFKNICWAGVMAGFGGPGFGDSAGAQSGEKLPA